MEGLLERNVFEGEFGFTDSSEIVDFFVDSTVLITGGTGFLGKILLEKLLRECEQIRKIYLLIRLKSYHSTRTRFTNLFSLPIFHGLRRSNPESFEKIEFIRGDFNLPGLGLSAPDIEKLLHVDVIFNCASTSMLDIPLKLAAEVNVRGLRDLIYMAKRLKKLKAFVHFSSLYVNSNPNILNEDFGRSLISSKALIEFIESLDPRMKNLQPIVLGDYPSNYIFTKAVAEDLIKTEGGSLPLAILRPAMVISTSDEPIPGWVDNVNGPTGLTMTLYLGLSKSLLASKDKVSHMIPADYVVNAAIAAAWNIAKTKIFNENSEIVREDKVPIYNIVSAKTNPLTWGKFFKLSSKYSEKMPTIYLMSHPWYFITSSKFLHNILVFLLHYVPGYFLDLIGFYFKGKAKYLSYYNKIYVLSETLSYFTLNSWVVEDGNAGRLWGEMGTGDREKFNFDAANVYWDRYFEGYVHGMRKFVLKDSMETLEEGVRVYNKKKAWSYLIKGLFLAGLFYFQFIYVN